MSVENNNNVISQYCFLGIIAFTLFSTSVNASYLLEYSLTLNKHKTSLDFNNITQQKAEIDQASIHWYESFTSYFDAGLEFGYTEMTQLDNALISAKYTSGQYAGLLFRFIPVDSEYLSLRLNLNYRYNKTEGKSVDQLTTFRWDENSASTELEFHPLPLFDLFLLMEYRDLNGKQLDSGITSSVTPFTNTQQINYRAGINFKTKQKGVIRLEWLTGNRNGVKVAFARRF